MGLRDFKTNQYTVKIELTKTLFDHVKRQIMIQAKWLFMILKYIA